MRPYHALVITTDFPPVVGGIQEMLDCLLRRMPGIKPVVLAPLVPGSDIYDKTAPFVVYRTRALVDMGDSRIKHLAVFAQAFWLAIKHRVHFIIVPHVYPAGWSAYLLHRTLRLPYVVFTYGMEILGATKSQGGYQRLKRILLSGSLVATISRFTAEQLHELGVPQHKVEILPPGVDVSRFTVENAGKRQAADLQAPVLLTVGRLVERKGHALVLQALSALRERFPGIKYLISGKGPHEKALRETACKYGVEDSVTFLGEVSAADLPHLYRQADLVVMPTRFIREKGDFEGFGLVYLEAAASGKPAIGSVQGGALDAIVPGETGLLVSGEDPTELVEKITMILSNPTFATGLGQQGRQRVCREFTWERAAERYQAKILDAIARSGEVGGPEAESQTVGE